MSKENFVNELVQKAEETNVEFLKYVKSARLYGVDTALRETIAKIAVLAAELQIFARLEGLKEKEP